jgi:hypothetical protein
MSGAGLLAVMKELSARDAAFGYPSNNQEHSESCDTDNKLLADLLGFHLRLIDKLIDLAREILARLLNLICGLASSLSHRISSRAGVVAPAD